MKVGAKYVYTYQGREHFDTLETIIGEFCVFRGGRSVGADKVVTPTGLLAQRVLPKDNVEDLMQVLKLLQRVATEKEQEALAIIVEKLQTNAALIWSE